MEPPVKFRVTVAAGRLMTFSILSLISLASFSVSGQRIAGLLRFEVVSIKQSRPVAGQGVIFGMVSDPGRFRASFVTLTDLMGKAYGVDVARISGGPPWVSAERYDVIATLPANASQEQIPIILQALLADRFGLTVRRATKMSQVYALVPAKGGPKLKRSEAARSPSSTGPPSIFSSSTPGIVSAGGAIRLCCGRANLLGISMARLAELLTSQTDRPVQDNTGIPGLFDVSLEWTPDDARPQPGPAPPTGPSIYVAIQEQLGLRLEPRAAPSEYLVIEHAVRPTEN